MPKLRLKLWHKFELLAALPLVACAGVLLTLGLIYTYSDHQISEAQRARETLDTCEYLMRTITQVTAKLWTTTGIEMGTEQALLNNTKVKLRDKLKTLKELCKDDPAEYKSAIDIENAVETSFKTMQESITKKSEHGIATALKIMGFKMETEDQARELLMLNHKLADQLAARVSNADVPSTAEMMRPLILVAAILIVSLSAITAYILNRNVVTRLSKLVANSKRLAKLDVLVAPTETNEVDEIADLNEVFHTMAGSLAEAIARERASIEKAADVICTLNKNGAIKSINSACVEAWGFEANFLIDKSILEIVHSEDRNKTKSFLAGLTRSSAMETLDNRLVRKDGKTIDVLWSCRKGGVDGEIFSIAHDITERKLVQDNLRKSEDRFAAIKERMPAGIIIFNDNGKVLDFNPSAESMTGRNTNELRGAALKEIMPAINLDALNLAQWSHPRENEIVHSDGTVKTADIIVSQLNTSEDQNYLSVMIDTTDRHELEKIKETLVAMIAHDIATPMTTIHSQLHLAQLGAMGELTEEGAQLVKSAETQSTELMNVLTTVMKTAKYQHAAILKGLAKTRLADLVDAAVESTESERDSKNIEMHVQIDRSLQLYVEPDSATHALKVVLGQLVQTCSSQQVLTIESFADEDANDNKVLLRISHPRNAQTEQPGNLAWEFACAIVNANNGHLRFMSEQKFVGCEFEFTVGSMLARAAE
ncbi:MAG: PAS domain S-box protein [Cyanobacteria bacterium SZAS-4]|nr:PAS domain S-box protein [Cyanobacteria bacterium SZAS-4]